MVDQTRSIFPGRGEHRTELTNGTELNLNYVKIDFVHLLELINKRTKLNIINRVKNGTKKKKKEIKSLIKIKEK